MEKYRMNDVNGTKDTNLKIAVVGAGLVSETLQWIRKFKKILEV